MVAAHPVVGVIGGMGPDATVDLMARILAATPANSDEDHIHIIVDNNPKIPSRIAAIIEKSGPDPTPELIRMAKGLQTAGATMLAIPCNTAHAYAEQISAAVDIPLLNMIVLTAERVGAMNLNNKRVSLLASSAVKIMGLYEKAFRPYGISPVYPQRQDELMDIILAVKKGDKGASTRKAFADIAHELAEQADSLLVACTELSVLADVLEGAPMLDALDVLAEEIVASCLAGTGRTVCKLRAGRRQA